MFGSRFSDDEFSSISKFNASKLMCICLMSGKFVMNLGDHFLHAFLIIIYWASSKIVSIF
jgi:hypothetical protein